MYTNPHVHVFTSISAMYKKESHPKRNMAILILMD